MSDLDKNALLPCPFCGGEADYEEVAGPTVNGSSWSVGCANVDADCIGYQLMASFTRKCEAAAAWNTRAAPQAPPDVVEIMAKECDSAAGRFDPPMNDYQDGYQNCAMSIKESVLAALQAAGFVIRKDGK